MKLWAEVYDASGARLGDAPLVHINGMNLTRALDRCGTWQIETPGTDGPALDLLRPKRRIRIYAQDDAGNPVRVIARGVIEKVTARDDPGGWTRVADGPDDMAELKFASALLGRKYDAQTVSAIADDLLGLAGWTREGDVSALVSMRVDGASAFKALQSLVAQQGVHFRPGSGTRTVEVGAFGADSGVVAINAAHAPQNHHDNLDLCLIEAVTLVEDSEELVNWLLPLGAGQGDAALSLEKSTRSGPYTIESLTGPDGRALYYLRDTASIAAYGQVQKVGTFKQIAPISNSNDDLVAAANALYDAAAAWLQRYSQQQNAYTLTLRGVKRALQPGDKLHVAYAGRVLDNYGQTVDYRSIDADFWIMEASESWNEQGIATRLKVASVDRHQIDSAQVVIGALEEIRINNISVAPYFSKDAWKDKFEIDSTHSAQFGIVVTNATAAVTRCVLRLETTPFRSTAKSPAHRHKILHALSTSVAYTTHLGTACKDSSGTTAVFTLGAEVGAGEMWTYSADGAQEYGIYDDAQYPDTVSVTVNGQTVSGGPWGVGGVPVDVELDITALITNQTPLQKAHPIVIACTGGRGLVRVHVELYETIQSISVF